MAIAATSPTRGNTRDQRFAITALILGWVTSTVQGFRGTEWLIAGTVGPVIGIGIGLMTRFVFRLHTGVSRFMFWTTLVLLVLHVVGRVMDWAFQQPVWIMA